LLRKNKLPKNTWKNMNSKIKQIALVSWLTLTQSICLAQVQNGSYIGKMECGPLLTSPIQGPWSLPIQLTFTDNSVSWLRSSLDYSEIGSSSIKSGHLNLNLTGAWYSGGKNRGSWITVAELDLQGEKLTGGAIIYSEDGTVRLRDCRVSALVNTKALVETPVSASSVVTNKTINNVLNESYRRVAPILDKEVIQKQNIQKQQSPVTVVASSTLKDLDKLVYSRQEKLQGSLFNSKVEFLSQIKNGKYLNLGTASYEDMDVFSRSLIEVMKNDYGVVNWPLQRIIRNGVVVNEFSSSCLLEISQIAKRTFSSSIDFRLSNLKRDAARSTTTSSVDENNAYSSSINSEIEFLKNKKDSFCSSNGVHSYPLAFIKLYEEFDKISSDLFSEILISTRATNKEKADQEISRLTSAEAARQERREIAIEKERIKEQQRDRLLAEKMAMKRSAPERHAGKIKTLGFESKFLEANIMMNYMGTWGSIGTTKNWIAQVLDNKKITGIEPIFASRNPGILLKFSDTPSVKIYFKVDDKNVIIHKFNIFGQESFVTTLAQHSEASLFMSMLTE
jgi:hypothetical protein